jgi:hypothetical protein
VSNPYPPQQPYGQQPQPGQPYGQQYGQPQQYGQSYGQPRPGYGAPQAGSAIALTTKFMPLAFFFFFVKPNISVDGYPVAAEWGRTVIPVQPGQHRVDVYTPYFLPPKVGPADTTVNVPTGQTVELEYRSPLIAFSKGSLGAPPQKYNGMWLMIVLLVATVLLVVCGCGLSLLSSSPSST